MARNVAALEEPSQPVGLGSSVCVCPRLGAAEGWGEVCAMGCFLGAKSLNTRMESGQAAVWHLGTCGTWAEQPVNHKITCREQEAC